MTIRAAILGPTGYTGYWLIELLLRHPDAQITCLASARDELPDISQEFPQLRGRCEILCKPMEPQAIAKEADVAFLALPHKAAMEHAPALLDAGVRVVDLSADYRLRDPGLYERTYQTPHVDPTRLAQAIYGLPELYRSAVAKADLVANPGCYPTSAILAIAPLLERSLVQCHSIIINAASGVSGAGRSPKPHLHFAEVNEAYAAYGCGDHRHQPEIEQTLSQIKGQEVGVLFVPHLLPVDRGILSTIYLEPFDGDVSQDDLVEAFQEAYREEPFIRLCKNLPNIKHVRDTNFCDISVRLAGPEGSRKVVVFSAIDNMIKGASGQAIQNMNLMFGLDETSGLL